MTRFMYFPFGMICIALPTAGQFTNWMSTAGSSHTPGAVGGAATATTARSAAANAYARCFMEPILGESARIGKSVVVCETGPQPAERDGDATRRAGVEEVLPGELDRISRQVRRQ